MRLNQKRQKELEPKRVDHAKRQIEALGYKILSEYSTRLTFKYKGEIIQVFPYFGWHTGASIKDGRGINNLLKQIK